jgi:hypothetical protein
VTEPMLAGCSVTAARMAGRSGQPARIGIGWLSARSPGPADDGEAGAQPAHCGGPGLACPARSPVKPADRCQDANFCI